ncbi:MAG TPA: PLP-dependent cysteine synthase family protein [Sphingomicrobium sp.]|nr:PLP-dependent cysteine synthase family protein [Sphingomicrobium sp.]
MEADRQRSGDTHLLRLALPELKNVDVYLKDEAVHPTGSLKHRLARSLFLHAICNGDIYESVHIVEASSGSTAIAEAFFANLLGLEFTAVVPKATAPCKIEMIRKASANVHFAQPGYDLCAVAAELADRPGYYFMDQFTYAERATDWRGNNNIAESIFDQMRFERHPVPAWIVVGAGTGGTASTIGRYIRYRSELEATRLCVVDPQGSYFFKAFAEGEDCGPATNSDHIEGIGRKRPSPSFVPALVDQMISVPDAASIAAARWLETRIGKRFGPSTGTNLIGILSLANDAQELPRGCSIVTIGGDQGNRYAKTIYDDDWVLSMGLDLGPWTERFEAFESGLPFNTDGLLICRGNDPSPPSRTPCSKDNRSLKRVPTC